MAQPSSILARIPGFDWLELFVYLFYINKAAYFIMELELMFFFLPGPLDPNPAGDIDRLLNKLRMKFRTSMVPCDHEHVCFFPVPCNFILL